ncbi:MAG: aldehyde dehydrogenase family protein, partial [Chitinivibrionales bacterium]|nr:aldehyde dehydrogenase family protein [Chitinivibrionales bacterium]
MVALSTTMETSHEQITAIYSAQRASQNSGKSRAKGECLALLGTLERMLRENRGAIVHALAADMRKPPHEAWAADIVPVLSEIEHTRRRLDTWLRPHKERPTLLNRPARAVHYPCPFGTALIIGPWNYPFGLVLAPLVSALAAGNSAVLKPSEYAPASSALLTSLCERAFAPADIACV